MKIQILGTGCAKCNDLLANAETAIKNSGVMAEVEKITAINDIMKFGVMTTPALAIDGKVVSAGKLLSPAEIAKFFSENNPSCCRSSNDNQSCCSSDDDGGCCFCSGKGGKIFLIALIILAIILYFATRKAESNEPAENVATPNAQSESQNETQSEIQYEVLFFHASWRCVNCNNGETWTNKAVEQLRAEKVGDGKIIFRPMQLETNAELVKQLNAKRVDVFIVKKDGDKIVGFGHIANLLPLIRDGKENTIIENIKNGVNKFIGENL